MIEALLTLTIMWTTNNTKIPCVLQPTDEHICYVVKTNTIYISKETKAQKDFALYHEIGHAIFKNNFDKTLFKNGISPDYEVVADSFAWWILKNKGREVAFVNSTLSEEKQNYFAKICNKDCIKLILKK